MKTIFKVMLIVVGLFILLVIFRGGQRFLNFTKTEIQAELSLGQITGKNYNFYYPKKWVKGNEEGAELAYFATNENGEQTGEGITLEISTGSTKLETPTKELCDKFAIGLVSVTSLKGTAVSAVPVTTHPIYQGCKIINTFDVSGLVTTSEVKMIWYKDSRDNTLYVSQANYFSDTPAETIKTVKDSVNTFSLI